MTEAQAARSEADSGWKEILEKYLPRFLEFFFPDAGGEIKPTRCKFQDSEFQKIAQGGATGRQYVDKLVRVSIRDCTGTISHHVQGTVKARISP